MVTSDKPYFRYNEQQDAAEVLQVLLDEFTVHSLLSHNLVSFQLSKRTTCNNCHSDYLTEEPGNILQLNASSTIQSSLHKFLESEQLTDENRYFCYNCSSLQSREIKYNITSTSPFLIIQVKRFIFQGNMASKDLTLIKNSTPLSVPIVDREEVSVNKVYQLCAVINYSGTVNRGHYWASFLAMLRNLVSFCLKATFHPVI